MTATASAVTAGGTLTSERDECKYLLPRARLETLAAVLDRHLPSHRFTGPGANRLPAPQHFVTTIYFDTPSRVFFRGADASAEHNVKVRAKEYYDVHPSLAELATAPDDIVRHQPQVWFELKRREGALTTKRRFSLPKRDIPTILENIGQTQDDGSEGDVAAIMQHCRGLGEPLRVDCLVNYRRLSWQDAAGDLRVTIDQQLAFYAPPEDLWTRTRALTRNALGPVRGREEAAIVEIKTRGAVPSWIDQELSQVSARRVPYSKFMAATKAVHDGG